MLGTFLLVIVVISVLIYLIQKSLKKDKQKWQQSADSVRHSGPTPSVPTTTQQQSQLLDPFDQQPLQDNACLVTIPFNGGKLTFKTNPRNVSRIRKSGLPNKSRSFKKGSHYHMSFSPSRNSKIRPYTYSDTSVNWWDVYMITEMILNESYYQESYYNVPESQFGGFEGGQFGGGGASGNWDQPQGELQSQEYDTQSEVIDQPTNGYVSQSDSLNDFNNQSDYNNDYNDDHSSNFS